MLLVILTVIFPLLFVTQNQLFVNEEILIIVSIVVLLLSLVTIFKINFDKNQKTNEHFFYNFFLINLKSTRVLVVAEANSMLINNLFVIANNIAEGTHIDNIDE